MSPSCNILRRSAVTTNGRRSLEIQKGQSTTKPEADRRHQPISYFFSKASKPEKREEIVDTVINLEHVQDRVSAGLGTMPTPAIHAPKLQAAFVWEKASGFKPKSHFVRSPCAQKRMIAKRKLGVVSQLTGARTSRMQLNLSSM